MLEPELSPAEVQRIRARYDQLKARLGQLDWICQGSVMYQPPNAWRWTRKVRAKTVTVSLSAAQAVLYQEAIANHRELEAILTEMRELSQQVLMKSVPGVRKRKR
jgi:hypothetical protein